MSFVLSFLVEWAIIIRYIVSSCVWKKRESREKKLAEHKPFERKGSLYSFDHRAGILSLLSSNSEEPDIDAINGQDDVYLELVPIPDIYYSCNAIKFISFHPLQPTIPCQRKCSAIIFLTGQHLSAMEKQANFREKWMTNSLIGPIFSCVYKAKYRGKSYLPSLKNIHVGKSKAKVWFCQENIKTGFS